jgi:hypothetical protein
MLEGLSHGKLFKPVVHLKVSGKSFVLGDSNLQNVKWVKFAIQM